MKAAAVYPGKRTIGLVDVDEPKIVLANDVKIRILRVGVCGTDREICSFEYGTPPDGSEFLVLGHESLGEVVEVGPDVSDLKPGDLVVPMVRRPCAHPECLACRSGRQDFCYTGDFTERGIKQRYGFMTELVVDERQYMNHVPSELRDIAILTEPLTIAEKALIEVLQIQQRLPWGCPTPGQSTQYCHKAVVLGAGPVGLLGAMTLVNAGFQTWVYSRDREPSAGASVVTSIGAKYISSQDKSVDRLAAEVGNIDLVYEAVGASQFAFDVLRGLGVNGLFVFTGVPGHNAPVSIDTSLIMRNMVLKNQGLLGSVNAGRDAFEAAIRDLASFNRKWPDAVRSLITGHFPLDQFETPIASHDGIKNVIEIAA